MSPPAEQFRDAVRAFGIEPPAVIEPGKIHRFSTNGKRGDTAGWCKLFEDGCGGVFGDFRTGLSSNWQAKRDKPFTAVEREEFKHRCEAERREREAEEARRHAEAAERAKVIWKEARPAPDDHPYLASRRVQAHCVRVHGGALVIPVRDSKGELHSLQFIEPDGNKRFLTGGRVSGHYFAIGDFAGASILCIAEGYATGAAIHEATGYPVAVAFNAGNLEAVAKTLRDRVPDLIFCADDDVNTAGNPGLTKAAAAAQAVGGKVAVPNFGAERPEGATDFNDLRLACGADAVRRAIESAKPLSETTKINLTNQELPKVTKLAWDALIDANDPPQVFRHGSLAARIETDDHGYPIIRELTLDRMRYRLARVASWRAFNKNNVEVHAKPPMDVVRDVLATPDLPLPVLSHIAEAPIFAADGTLQTEPGYHPRTQNFYAPAAAFLVPPVPNQPIASDIKRAREIIEELLCDFPFTTAAEKAHAVALLILPFARNLIDKPTPLHLIEKPSPGTGASLLTDALSYVATGHTAPVMTEARDEDEWRKRITSKLRGGPSIILIDNLSRRLNSAALSAAITSLVWTDRILGHSEDVRIPIRCAWIATGNNPVVSSEIARRVVRIRLDAKRDRPWERKDFKHADLRDWVAQHRGEIVWSALTLIQAWLAAGRPAATGSAILGGFEDWSRVIGSILEVSGINGFLQNLTEFYEASDDEGKTWRAFVAAWRKQFAHKDVGVSTLFEVATGLDEAFNLGDKGERSQKIRLGKLLAGARDRQFTVEINGVPISLKIVSAGAKDRAGQWKLVRVEAQEPWE